MGLFNKKTDRAMDTMRERNKRYLESQGTYTEEEQEETSEITEEKRAGNKRDPVYEDGTFEKGDIPAIIISAFIVFGPILLICALIVLLVFKYLR